MIVKMFKCLRKQLQKVEHKKMLYFRDQEPAKSIVTRSVQPKNCVSYCDHSLCQCLFVRLSVNICEKSAHYSMVVNDHWIYMLFRWLYSVFSNEISEVIQGSFGAILCIPLMLLLTQIALVRVSPLLVQHIGCSLILSQKIIGDHYYNIHTVLPLS